MTTQPRFPYVIGGMLIAFLAFGASAQAQQQGITSGPAVGTNVVPSTTAQKEDPTKTTSQGGQSSDPGLRQGAIGVGAPGVAAKSGSESGTSPGPGSGKRP